MPEKPTLKVIIDTNLWISFLIGKELASLKQLIVELVNFEGTEISTYKDFLGKIN
jgi:hypothetical protein